MPRLCTQIGDRCKFTDDSCCMKQQTVGQKEKQNKTTKSICSWGEGLGLRTQNFDRRNVGYKRAKLYILFRNSPGELAVDTGSQSSSVVFPHTACRRPLQLPLPRATSTPHRSTSRSVFFSPAGIEFIMQRLLSLFAEISAPSLCRKSWTYTDINGNPRRKHSGLGFCMEYA